MKRWWACFWGLALLGLAPALAQPAPHPGSPEVRTGPRVLVVGSPAWNELMALPVEVDGPPPFHAAELLTRWGRPVEGDRLRRVLLLRHMQQAAGDARPPAQTVADLWRQAEAQAPAGDTLAAAHARALTRALAVERVGNYRTIVALRGLGPLTLAAIELTLHLPHAEGPVALGCRSVSPPSAIAPGSAEHWRCDIPPGAPAWVEPRLASIAGLASEGGWQWTSSDMQDPEALRLIAARVTGRPPVDLPAFIERNADCTRQGTCPARGRQARSPEELRARAEQQAASEARHASKARKRNLLNKIAPWVYGLVVLTVHILLARLLGRWTAIALTLGSGFALGWWMLESMRGSGSLAGIILPLAAVASGFVLAPVSDFVYRRFFAGL